jgi:putative N-acetylmannosamine-6-phosphate epimerase
VSTYEDEIALLAADIRRYSNNDGRIDEALTQMMKLVEAEVAALAFEAMELDRANRELERAVVRATTIREHNRITDTQPAVRWIEANNQAMGW